MLNFGNKYSEERNRDTRTYFKVNRKCKIFNI